MISDFCLSDYIGLNSTSEKPRIFLGSKTISHGNSYTSLTLKHNCFLCVWCWKVRIFLYLYSKCWQRRGRLLNSWNGYQKLHNSVNWFSDNVPYDIFVADDEHLIKMYEYLWNRRLINMHQKTPKHILKS